VLEPANSERPSHLLDDARKALADSGGANIEGIELIVIRNTVDPRGPKGGGR